ncbi:MAG: hypothetical protein UV61_C0007G0031 [Candidatus Gottesmanbacteria bacterium GW2011_GWB1_43_11]|uniref:Uncharacterized protein n=1 Tax=Candidatus Gottesmanbacteria bacterium GW2011_GWB1_43_11 TaxID=1618446 RepID=A0A0G1FIW1_9BACT|nr:MAG: hypothetical protein UV04_C0006G0031 [Candidatus Gottesmanbacteria bacterium GW2011_GWA2_42_16]KKS55844.1 MAG: hypothetical protein UV17_C0006G0001 [Candidatus Gottesmanbacteria bacterium GW2011_GWA1_42_26]KKS81244.1 MAG: hypothetical protein UV55_C0017G0001 [Candidatus Gottesmanbacteria bacterium GW2011_GWC1_43_10]KKS86773.1 MAG: hypothetical protein UV61_C0007G0031 [Candidatus Gottesmanbacteria bacterium GW2011_GWB1_43_11]
MDQRVEIPGPKKLSRRRFLKEVPPLLAGLLGLTALIDTESFWIFARPEKTMTGFLTGSDFWGRLATGTLGLTTEQVESLHEATETQFGIDLVQPEQESTVIYTSWAQKPTREQSAVVPWGPAELVTLAAALENLPTKMYQSGKYPFGVKTGFILVDDIKDHQPWAPISGFCDCSAKTGRVIIDRGWFEVGSREFNPRNLFDSLGFLAHELTHRVVLQENLDLPALLSQLGINSESELVEIFTIKNFDQFVQEQNTESSGNWFQYGNTTTEFPAVGASVYLKGWDSFARTYSPFLEGRGPLIFYIPLLLQFATS